MKHNRIYLFFWMLLLSVSSMAQSVEVTQMFRKQEYASVLTIYKNEFGKHEMPALDDPFPYAVVRIVLEGDEHAVETAMQKLGLYLGTMRSVEDKNLDTDNEILFLVPSAAGRVELLCGNGCDKQTIIDLPRLESNAIYEGRVRYTPAAPVAPVTTQAPKRQFFTFHVRPKDALVSVVENGKREIWRTTDGMASKMLNYGTYRYTISANRYQTEEGTFTLSDTETEKTITLLPKFGWLNVQGNAIAQGAYVYATNNSTGESFSLGTVPVTKHELDAGSYTVLVQQDKYKDYSTQVTIAANAVATLTPALEANFAQLTLTTSSGAEIYIDQQRLGSSPWSGTLELGEYTVETRQQSHRSAYTRVVVTPNSHAQTITLNAPVPIYGSLIVSGSPSMASLIIDGQEVGKTPRVIDNLLIGVHDIRIEMDGYLSHEQQMTITEGQEQTIQYTLSNDPEPIHQLGLDYYYGRNGKPQDYAEAVKWWRKAAEMGNATAQYNLGVCYEYGRGVTQDYAEAVKWYRKAAEQGDARAQCNLGIYYEHGQGVTQDYAEALKWYRKAAEQGNAYAQEAVARLTQ